MASSIRIWDRSKQDGEMAEVAEKTTGKLTPADRAAIIVYRQSLDPIRHKVAAEAPVSDD
jgi:hypothetical protein